MQLPLTIVALLTLYCPWVTDPLPPITVLPGPQYEEVAARYDPHLITARGMALWWQAPDGPEECRIFLREPPTVEITCHELRHCVEGHWH